MYHYSHYNTDVHADNVQASYMMVAAEMVVDTEAVFMAAGG